MRVVLRCEDDVTAAVPPRLPHAGRIRPLWPKAMTGPPVRV